MRRSTDPPFNAKEFVAERNRVLRHGTPAELKEFMRARDLPVPKNKHVLLLTWHKSITAAHSLDKEYRQKSKDWLSARGHHSLDDGDLV
jgi:hypothetical protein